MAERIVKPIGTVLAVVALLAANAFFWWSYWQTIAGSMNFNWWGP